MQPERISSMQISLIYSTKVAVLTLGRHFWLSRPASIFNCTCSLITIFFFVLKLIAFPKGLELFK